MCFSLDWLLHVLIIGVIIAAVIAIPSPLCIEHPIPAPAASN